MRRCEAAEICKAIRGAALLAAVDREQKASILWEKFTRLVGELRLARSPVHMGRGDVRRPGEIQDDLDAVCSELRRSSPGLDRLIKALDALAAEAGTQGKLSETSEALLSGCLGASKASAVLQMNAFIKKWEDDKGRQDTPPKDSKVQGSPNEKEGKCRQDLGR